MKDSSASASLSMSRRRLLGAAAVGATAVTTGAFGFRRADDASDPSIWRVQTARFQLDPERLDEALAVLREMTEEVEAEEPGVLTYVCHRPQKEPHTVFFYEVYATAQDLALHGQTPHFKRLLGANFGKLFLPPFEVVQLDVLAAVDRS